MCVYTNKVNVKAWQPHDKPLSDQQLHDLTSWRPEENAVLGLWIRSRYREWTHYVDKMMLQVQWDGVQDDTDFVLKRRQRRDVLVEAAHAGLQQLDLDS